MSAMPPRARMRGMAEDSACLPPGVGRGRESMISPQHLFREFGRPVDYARARTTLGRAAACDAAVSTDAGRPEVHAP